ncbi:MAG TPA: prephenate dehydrogenase/arogenate dehydrogenase family protein [Thermoanaerobaculia bacterium]|jgi:prephenate dehydrogenase|nr:prephenate dehydrogenase/arogenate dehydrogenase family protein [Thermoanaerobaculia bacterium]
MALRRRGWRVAYVDPHVELVDAQRVGAADERVDTPAQHDVIVLATPVDAAVALLRTLESNSVVTSTCSVMRPLREAARGTFVAGHPMAGSHEHGLSAAHADLFEGKPWFLDAQHEVVDALVRDCGAVIERVDAAEHDAAVALTSHLPQVLSTALAAYLHDREDLLRFAGSGLRTFLRLAGSDADVWAPVLAANRDQLAPHAEAIAQIVKQIIEGDPRDAFEKAQAVWRALEARSQ